MYYVRLHYDSGIETVRPAERVAQKELASEHFRPRCTQSSLSCSLRRHSASITVYSIATRPKYSYASRRHLARPCQLSARSQWPLEETRPPSGGLARRHC
eukprot:6181103-Pleurochrysis_carterae.AAC.1